MRSSEMVCENCDYYEPWDTQGPLLLGFRHIQPYKDPWTLEVDGSCRRYPPTFFPVSDEANPLPGYPFFPAVARNYWCGKGRWTDPESGERYQWGDWDE